MPVPFISIIAEDKESLQSMATGLEKMGLPVRGYCSLKSALETAFSAPPTLLIFDLPLDATQLEKLLTFLRQHQKMRDIPVVIISEENRCRKLKVAPEKNLECVSKPLVLGELAARIRDLLARCNNHALLDRWLASSAILKEEFHNSGTASGNAEVKHKNLCGTLNDNNRDRRIDGASDISDKPVPGQPYTCTTSVDSPLQVACSEVGLSGKANNNQAEAESASQESDSAASNAARPTIHAVNPSLLECSEQGIEVSINGENFLSSFEASEIQGQEYVQGSVAYFEKQPLPTLFYSSSQLKAYIAKSLIPHRKRCCLQVGNPAIGPELSDEFEVQVANPLPRLAAIEPEALAASAQLHLITIRGSGFVPESLVYLGEELAVPEHISPEELRVQLTPSLLLKPGAITIQVYNPDPGGGVSQMATLQYLAANPRIENLEPGSVPAFSRTYQVPPENQVQGFTLAVKGQDFVDGSIIYFDGIAVETRFESPELLSGQIPHSLLREAGSYAVTVLYPTDNGFKLTNHGTFTVTPPLPVIRHFDPEYVTADTGQASLNISGLYFRAECTVHVGQQVLTPEKIEPEKISILIPPNLLVDTAELPIVVESPAPSPGFSNAAFLRVLNPTPTLNSLAPERITAGSDDVTLELAGSHFLVSSQVFYNNSLIPSVTESPALIRITIPAELVNDAGHYAICVHNPQPGGGISNALHLLVSNPRPQLLSTVPEYLDYAVQGEPEILLIGHDFVSQSVVYCNEESCSTSFIDSRHLSLTLPARFLENAEILRFKVGNPSPGGGISAELGFEIRNPEPKMLSITPTIMDAGWQFQSITIQGRNFVPTSSILFNGQKFTPQYLDAQTLLLQLGPRELTQAGIYSISVTNPAPGGGESDTFELILNYPHPEISYLLPCSCEVGVPKIELTVHGTKFAAEASIVINGEERETQRPNPTELRTILQKRDLYASQELQVQVENPKPTCGPSNTLKFMVLNPVPYVEMIEVDESANRDERLLITVHGTHFNTQTRVYLDDSLVQSACQTPNTLLASVPDRLLSGQSLMLLTVENPGPGGGRTSGASLMLNQGELAPSNSSVTLPGSVTDLDLDEKDIVVLDFEST